MTALAGLWKRSGGGASRDCSAMLGAQHIYGPDHRATIDLGAVAIGRNLKRILPEDAFDRQPLRGGAGRFAMVADARIDNRSELAETLGIDAQRLRGMCDADLLLAAYEAWEEACCDRVTGAFAFAVWDAKRHRLVLARDAVGHRPLHFFHSPKLTAFASMPKKLLALPEIERAPDMEFVEQALVDVSWKGDRSFFEHIKRVRPGHYAVIDGNGVRHYRHWNPAPAPLLLDSYEDYVDALRAALDTAVARQLRGVDSVAAHLSAGLDSPAVATSAALHLAGRGRVSAYTAVPRAGYDGTAPNRIVDEAPYAAAVAALYPNIDHHLVEDDKSSPVARMERIAHLYDQPAPNLCNQGWYSAIHARAKADGHSVLLSAGVGNIGFSYDGNRWSAGLLRQGRVLRLLRHLAALNGAGWADPLAELRGSLMATLPAGVQRTLRRWRRGKAFLGAHPDLLARTGSRATAMVPDPVAMRVRWFERIDGGNMAKGTLAAWGLDERDPSADKDLIELCLAIPAEHFCHRGVPRSLARAMLADRLPAAHLAERKKGLQAADWHECLDRERLAQEVEIIAQFDGLRGIIDTPRLKGWSTTGPRAGGTIPRLRCPIARPCCAA